MSLRWVIEPAFHPPRWVFSSLCALYTGAHWQNLFAGLQFDAHAAQTLLAPLTQRVQLIQPL